MVEPLVVSKFPSDRRARSQLKKAVFPGGFQTANIRPNGMRLLPDLFRPTSLSSTTASGTESLTAWMKSEQTPICNHKSFLARTPGLKSPSREPYTTWATGGFNSDCFADEDDDGDPDPFRNVAGSYFREDMLRSGGEVIDKEIPKDIMHIHSRELRLVYKPKNQKILTRDYERVFQVPPLLPNFGGHNGGNVLTGGRQSSPLGRKSPPQQPSSSRHSRRHSLSPTRYSPSPSSLQGPLAEQQQQQQQQQAMLNPPTPPLIQSLSMDSIGADRPKTSFTDTLDSYRGSWISDTCSSVPGKHAQSSYSRLSDDSVTTTLTFQHHQHLSINLLCWSDVIQSSNSDIVGLSTTVPNYCRLATIHQMVSQHAAPGDHFDDQGERVRPLLFCFHNTISGWRPVKRHSDWEQAKQSALECGQVLNIMYSYRPLDRITLDSATPQTPLTPIAGFRSEVRRGSTSSDHQGDQGGDQAGAVHANTVGTGTSTEADAGVVGGGDVVGNSGNSLSNGLNFHSLLRCETPALASIPPRTGSIRLGGRGWEGSKTAGSRQSRGAGDGPKWRPPPEGTSAQVLGQARVRRLHELTELAPPRGDPHDRYALSGYNAAELAVSKAKQEQLAKALEQRLLKTRW